MKKILMTTGIAVLALATIVGAQAYTFSTNLTIGSTGPDVVALQTLLIANGYSIPAIASGAANKGYFGSQTKAAAQAYQTAHGIPSTGFVGPLTRGALNSGAGVSMTGGTCPVGYTCTQTAPVVSTTCPVGYTCTANPGMTQTGTVTAPTGITTPGVPGIMTVTSGPLSSSVLNVGAQNVPLETVRVQSQYSDIDVQSITLDLGNNTAFFNKLFTTITITDSNGNVLATQSLNGSTVVQSGSEYILGIAGFHFIVPKGTYRDLTIKGSLNSSIDSNYISSTGSHYPNYGSTAANSINATAVTGWGIGVVANGVRGVDGAGLNLYSPTTGMDQTFTINSSLVDNATANLSLDSASPTVASTPVSDTTNGQYLGLPVLIFDVNAQYDTLHLHEVKARIYTAAGGTGSVGAAYLYQGSTQIASASVSGGVADFTNISDGTQGATIPVNTTLPYTVKVDATGVTSGSLSITAGVATSTALATDLTVYNSIDGSASVNGSASGNAQTVANAGVLLSLVGSPTITKADVTPGSASVSTFQYVATFNVNIQAVGTSVDIGLPASSTAAFGSSSMTMAASNDVAQVYQNGTATTSTQALIPGYSQPTGTTLSSDTTYFTIARNNSVTVPVTYSFTITGGGANQYAVQLQGVYWEKSASGGALQKETFMRNQPQWRTTSI